MRLMYVVSALISLIWSVTALSQGRLIGRVTDNSGQPIVAATVSIASSSITQAAITNALGYYIFLDVPTGDYTIKAYKRGLPSWVKTLMVPSAMVRQDIQLALAQPADVAESKERNAERDTKKSAPRVADVPKENTKQPEPKKQPDKPAAPVAAAQAPPVKPEPATVTMALNAEITDAGLKKAVEDAKATDASEKATLEKRPEVIGGMNAIYSKLQYPAYARENQIEGSVMARVYVSKTGMVSKVSIIKAPDRSLSEEVFRVLSEDVEFQPASADNKPADGTVVIIVNFTLK